MAGGVFGAVTSAIAWFLLGGLFWMPYLSRLHTYRMSAHDNGWAMGTYIIPAIVALMFVVSSLVSSLAVRYPWGMAHSGIVLGGVSVIPGLYYVLLSARGFRRSGYWEYPGFEIALVLIGLAWGGILNEFVLIGTGD